MFKFILVQSKCMFALHGFENYKGIHVYLEALNADFKSKHNDDVLFAQSNTFDYAIRQ